MGISRYQQTVEVLILLAVAFFEITVVLNIATGFGGSAALAQEYLAMTAAPEWLQWRSLDLPFLGYIASSMALLFHLCAAVFIALGSYQLLTAGCRDEAHSAFLKCRFGLSVGILFYVAFFLAFGTWLQIRDHEYSYGDNAMRTAILYTVLAGYLQIRYGGTTDDA